MSLYKSPTRTYVHSQVEPANPKPLGGTEVGFKVGLWRTSGGWPPLILLFYPLTPSVPAHFPLHWFWPPTADLVCPLCLLQQQSQLPA